MVVPEAPVTPRPILSPDMATGAAILVVDDEESIQKLLTYPLERDGYRVVQARDGEEALARFREERPDLVLLDLALPKLDGLEVCRRIRAESSVPILMLTARDDEIDKVLGLEIGADDYITKPFSIRELRSRIRAAMRRASLAPQPEAVEVIESDGLRIDLPRRAVEIRGEQAQLTYLEFELLRTLAVDSGPRLHAPGSPRQALGRCRVPRPDGRSTSTCATCGRRSSATRATPSTSSRSGASGTASGTPEAMRLPLPFRATLGAQARARPLLRRRRRRSRSST